MAPPLSATPMRLEQHLQSLIERIEQDGLTHITHNVPNIYTLSFVAQLTERNAPVKIYLGPCMGVDVYACPDGSVHGVVMHHAFRRFRQRTSWATIPNSLPAPFSWHNTLRYGLEAPMKAEALALVRMYCLRWAVATKLEISDFPIPHYGSLVHALRLIEQCSHFRERFTLSTARDIPRPVWHEYNTSNSPLLPPLLPNPGLRNLGFGHVDTGNGRATTVGARRYSHPAATSFADQRRSTISYNLDGIEEIAPASFNANAIKDVGPSSNPTLHSKPRATLSKDDRSLSRMSRTKVQVIDLTSPRKSRLKDKAPATILSRNRHAVFGSSRSILSGPRLSAFDNDNVVLNVNAPFDSASRLIEPAGPPCWQQDTTRHIERENRPSTRSSTAFVAPNKCSPLISDTAIPYNITTRVTSTSGTFNRAELQHDKTRLNAAVFQNDLGSRKLESKTREWPTGNSRRLEFEELFTPPLSREQSSDSPDKDSIVNSQPGMKVKRPARHCETADTESTLRTSDLPSYNTTGSINLKSTPKSVNSIVPTIHPKVPSIFERTHFETSLSATDMANQTVLPQETLYLNDVAHHNSSNGHAAVPPEATPMPDAKTYRHAIDAQGDNTKTTEQLDTSHSQTHSQTQSINTNLGRRSTRTSRTPIVTYNERSLRRNIWQTSKNELQGPPKRAVKRGKDTTQKRSPLHKPEFENKNDSPNRQLAIEASQAEERLNLLQVGSQSPSTIAAKKVGMLRKSSKIVLQPNSSSTAATPQFTSNDKWRLNELQRLIQIVEPKFLEKIPDLSKLIFSKHNYHEYVSIRLFMGTYSCPRQKAFELKAWAYLQPTTFSGGGSIMSVWADNKNERLPIEVPYVTTYNHYLRALQLPESPTHTEDNTKWASRFDRCFPFSEAKSHDDLFALVTYCFLLAAQEKGASFEQYRVPFKEALAKHLGVFCKKLRKKRNGKFLYPEELFIKGDSDEIEDFSGSYQWTSFPGEPSVLPQASVEAGQTGGPKRRHSVVSTSSNEDVTRMRPTKRTVQSRFPLNKPTSSGSMPFENTTGSSIPTEPASLPDRQHQVISAIKEKLAEYRMLGGRNSSVEEPNQDDLQRMNTLASELESLHKLRFELGIRVRDIH
ncbi:hypothetical protein K505DRAFT_333315 [Melanomma pulvis-pyrius CBS 109.77]|uniref:Uncharacterized protein n=1 Tax=Melanomma pulvis-pyrius CBS 109.77 TaxID=1314802 RepID=A0A6A6XQ39_9PLEO|nr:hypothetical protein K505DRAFT_333315 [Melanomma pulvis-pyrius CBS 109.77]